MLVLIIGVGLASATDINGTIDDASLQAIDHQCGVDEIDHSNPEIVQNDAGDVVDNSTVVTVENDNDNIDNSTDSTIAIENVTPETSNQKQITPNIIEDSPKKIDISCEKQDGIKKNSDKYEKYSQKGIDSEVKKYSDIFNKKNGKHFVRNTKFQYSFIDLILEVYTTHSDIDETILIATQALQNSGYNITLESVDVTFHQLMNGKLITGKNQTGGIAYEFLYFSIRGAHKLYGDNVFNEFEHIFAVNS